MERRHYQRIRQKALAEANVGVEPSPSRAKPILIGVGVIGVSLAIWGFINWVMPDPERAKNGSEDEAAVVEVEVDVGLGTLEVEELVNSFLKAESVERLLEIIDHPEISEPRLREFYAEGGPGKLPMGGRVGGIQKLDHQGEEVSAVAVQYLFGGPALIPVREGASGEPTIEWESTVGWMEPSWEEIVETKPTEPTVVRVFAYPDNYYNDGYLEDKKWGCLKLTGRDLETTCYAYYLWADEEMQEIKAIASIMKIMLPLTLEIKFRPGKVGSRGRPQAELVSLRSIGWIRE